MFFENVKLRISPVMVRFRDRGSARDRIYSLYSIKTITSMESPHKNMETQHVCVCVCVFACVCVCVCVCVKQLKAGTVWRDFNLSPEEPYI